MSSHISPKFHRNEFESCKLISLFFLFRAFELFTIHKSRCLPMEHKMPNFMKQ